MTRTLKKGGIMAIFSVIVIAVVILANLIFGKLPARYRQWDLSSSQILTLSETTLGILKNLDQNITIHVVADPDTVDERISSFVELYAQNSDRIQIIEEDPILHPDVLTRLDVQPGNILVECEGTGKRTVISFDDIIQIDLMAYYQYQQISETAFDGEGQLTSAIHYVANETATTAYTLTGHQESALPQAVTDSLDKSGFTMAELNLMTQPEVPADCSLLIIHNPQKDISADEKTSLLDYLKNGGHLMLLAGAAETPLTNLNSLCAEYGMDLKNGFTADQAPGHYYQNNPFSIIPEHDNSSGMLTGISTSDSILLNYAGAIEIQEELRDGLNVSPILTTSESGIFLDPITQEQTEGSYVVAAVATEDTVTALHEATASEAEASGENSSSQETEASGGTGDSQENQPKTVFTVIAAPSLIDESILTLFPNLMNLNLFMNGAVYEMPGVTSLSIPAKSLKTTYNMVTAGGLWGAMFIILIPLIFLIAGFVIWMKRRKK